MRFHDYQVLVENKVEALLRLPITAGIPSGYRPIREFFKLPYASNEIARRIQDVVGELHRGRITTRPLIINPAILIPTQYNVDGDDVADIMRKRHFPPVTIARYTGNYYIVDGHHRVAAALALNIRSIDANVAQIK